MIVRLLWEDESEREAVRQLQRDWVLYGEMHLTNAPRGNGLTRLDPRGITYVPPSETPPSSRRARSPLLPAGRA